VPATTSAPDVVCRRAKGAKNHDVKDVEGMKNGKVSGKLRKLSPRESTFIKLFLRLTHFGHCNMDDEYG